MPELPEVETMCLRVDEILAGRPQLTNLLVTAGEKNARKRYLPGSERTTLIGQQFTGLRRRGKHMLFYTTDGMVIAHNGMSGYWDTLEEPWSFDYVEGARTSSEKDVRVTATFSDGTQLRFHDARMFGSMRYYSEAEVKGGETTLKDLGPEAIPTFMSGGRAAWSLDRFVGLISEHLASRKKVPSVKEALMDQSRVAGIGNIYASEGLNRAGVLPSRPLTNLLLHEVNAVFSGVTGALKEALDHQLRYPEYLRVYRRSACGTCSSPITRTEIAGRSTYHCATCQR